MVWTPNYTNKGLSDQNIAKSSVSAGLLIYLFILLADTFFILFTGTKEVFRFHCRGKIVKGPT